MKDDGECTCGLVACRRPGEKLLRCKNGYEMVKRVYNKLYYTMCDTIIVFSDMLYIGFDVIKCHFWYFYVSEVG